MASFHTELNDKLMAFIREQHIYFVASAASTGRVNLSPKGMDTFRIFSPNMVGYLDLTGSGAETAAHILADGRLTIMFCAFTGDPLILRLYGRGEVVRPDDPRWQDLSRHFTMLSGTRQIVLLHIESLQTSCGFAVPKYKLVEERQKLIEWSEKKGPDGLAEYRAKKNVTSIDGLSTGL
jgi:Pyridoxamine 5'-phosphate oxidase